MVIFPSGPNRDPNLVHYLFVDGAYLRKVAELYATEFFPGVTMLVDYEKLIYGFTKAFYYDCLPPPANDESKEQHERRVATQDSALNEIRSVNGFRVFVGTMSAAKQQKLVDVKIAVDMLTHTYRRNMTRATLLSGDLDYKPAVDAMVQDGAYVTLWSDKSSVSRELAYAADARRELNVNELHKLCRDDFREKYPLPHLLCTMERVPQGFSTIQIGTLPDGAEVEQFSNGKDHVMVLPDRVTRRHFTHVTHSDVAMLHEFVNHLFGEVTWT